MNNMHNNPKPIPQHLEDEFEGYVSMADDPEAPDGAWWAMLLDAATAFMHSKKLKGDPHDAVHQYLDLSYD